MNEINEFNIAMGKRIRETRVYCGYSREKIRELTGISENFLYNVEIGKKGVSAENLNKLSQQLGVTTDYLMKGERAYETYENVTRLLVSLSKAEIKLIENITLTMYEFRNFSKKTEAEYAVV